MFISIREKQGEVMQKTNSKQHFYIKIKRKLRYFTFLSKSRPIVNKLRLGKPYTHQAMMKLIIGYLTMQ